MSKIQSRGFVRDPLIATKQIPTLKGINQTLYDQGKRAVKTTSDAGDFLNKFNAANAAISQGISKASEILFTMQAVINAPSEMVNTVKVRVSVLQSQFDTLRSNIEGMDRVDKINYENVGGTLVSSAAVNTVNNTEYKTKTDVLEQIDNLRAIHEAFLTDLDGLQTDNGGDEDSYIPNSDVLTALDELIKFTVANLYDIALSAKQERIVILEDDSNVILLAHRFYGLTPDDETIQQFIDNNNIGLNEILQIRKGRELSFYI